MNESAVMTSTPTTTTDGPAWDPPGPGPWMRDGVHFASGLTRIAADIWPRGAEKGFAASFGRFGLLLDKLAWGVVNGSVYFQPQPFDLSAPDQPPSPEWIGAEIERRTGLASAAFEGTLWRERVAEWKEQVKPAAIARHRALGDVDLAALDDAALRGHVIECLDHLEAMVVQHHDFNVSSSVVPALFTTTVGGWLGDDPTSLFAVCDGYSPASGVVSPELAPAIEALRSDTDAVAFLREDRDPTELLDLLRRKIPAVDEYVRSVGFRITEGLDVTCPTALERPELIVGRLVAGLEVDPGEARERADTFAASLRARLDDDRHAAFDEMLADARATYRLRDERALYSDISAFGLLRLALLEAGRRLAERHRVETAEHLFELDRPEIEAVLEGADLPSAAEIAARVQRVEELRGAAVPESLGPPPPEQPPTDQLPAPLAQVMGLMEFSIGGIFGQLEEPEGDERRIVGIGIPSTTGPYEGRVHLVASPDDLFDIQPGDVVVAATTGEALNSMLHLVGAIVTDHGSFASHAAIVARECGFPAVVGTTNATHRLRPGQRVRVDGAAGEIHVIGP